MVYEGYDVLKLQPKQLKQLKQKITDVRCSNTTDSRHSKIMMISCYTASIIAHYNASNRVAIFSDCVLGEPQTPPSFSHPDI